MHAPLLEVVLKVRDLRRLLMSGKRAETFRRRKAEVMRLVLSLTFEGFSCSYWRVWSSFLLRCWIYWKWSGQHFVKWLELCGSEWCAGHLKVLLDWNCNMFWSCLFQVLERIVLNRCCEGRCIKRIILMNKCHLCKSNLFRVYLIWNENVSMKWVRGKEELWDLIFNFAQLPFLLISLHEG